jgi:hypothetical protein
MYNFAQTPYSIAFMQIYYYGMYIAYKNYMKRVSKSYMSLRNNIIVKGRKTK